MVTEKEIWKFLEEVYDPEIPVLTVVDLGVVQKVKSGNNYCKITITPTYSGCPAMHRMHSDIEDKLAEKGIKNVEVELVLSPAWTTDWISESGRKKLKEYGIAPPVDEPDKSILFATPLVVPCPLCESDDTKLISQFGSTACKAHYKCNKCLEPFDYFKCLK
jgi:ring-1,2-phenylacetyl-CoA epoxidase subunit PaaD